VSVRPDTSIFAFAHDLVDEGLESALDRIESSGIRGLSLAAVYHDGRDIYPHNPRGRVLFNEDGVAFFRPDESIFSGSTITPLISSTVDLRGPFERTLAAAHNRGLAVHAWTVFLHNTALGRRHPAAVTRNVYGDPQLTSLCPANPEAAAYAIHLASSIAQMGVDSLNAEGLHFLPLEHGYHHERYFIRIGPIDRLLLGLCFCAFCQDRAGNAGIDVDALMSSVRARLDRMLETAEAFDPSPDTHETLASLWSGELGAFLSCRDRTVTELVAEVSDAVRKSGTTFTFNDPAGAFTNAGDQAAGEVPPESWRLGIDPAAVARHCDDIQILGYSESPDAVHVDVGQYQKILDGAAGVRVALRPVWPDSESAVNLRAKLDLLSQLEVAGVDFYHYSFMRLEDLDRIESTLTELRWASRA
jgi:hypothetical protein